MRHNCCHLSLASILKLLNFFQAFVGVAIIIYSVWMLDQWNHHLPISPPPLAPSPGHSGFPYLLNSGIQTTRVSDQVNRFKFASDLFVGFGNRIELDMKSLKLPAPWFIYSFMGLGISLCVTTLIGCIAAEIISGCCLCFYAVLSTVILLLEAALVAFIAINHQWQKNLPLDPTGELDSLLSFIEENADICKWVGIAVLIIQASSLLLAIILRSIVSPRTSDLDEEEGYEYENVRGRTREPLLNHTPGSSKDDGWSSRIREKYGLNGGDKHNPIDPNVNSK